MNDLQQFLADANAQVSAILGEDIEINGSVYQGTFGDPQLMPVMTRAGYQDHLVIPLKISAAQFAEGSPPAAKQLLIRVQTKREFFVQMVDYTNPVVFTFLLVDREI